MLIDSATKHERARCWDGLVSSVGGARGTDPQNSPFAKRVLGAWEVFPVKLSVDSICIWLLSVEGMSGAAVCLKL